MESFQELVGKSLASVSWRHSMLDAGLIPASDDRASTQDDDSTRTEVERSV
jgi:hypothetical protein